MAVSDRRGGAKEPGKAGVAPTASLNDMRRSEKAVIERHNKIFRG